MLHVCMQERGCEMSSVYEPVNNRHYMDATEADKKTGRKETLTVFNALRLKEKCLYLMKISKRNTCYKALVLMGFMLVMIAVGTYLL